MMLVGIKLEMDAQGLSPELRQKDSPRILRRVPLGSKKVLDNLGNIRTLGLRKPTKAHRVLESAEEPPDGSRQEK